MSLGAVGDNKECSMADNRNPNEKHPGDHYNPGNQAGKTAGVIKKPEAERENNVDRENDRDAAKPS
jgi:hypothetical protein